MRDLGGAVMLRSALSACRLEGAARRLSVPRVRGSGAAEWSRREVARLHPGWPARVLRKHRSATRTLKAVLAFFAAVSLVATLLGVERYMHWARVAQAQMGEAVTLTKWESWCRVYPQDPHCAKAEKRPMKPTKRRL